MRTVSGSIHSGTVLCQGSGLMRTLYRHSQLAQDYRPQFRGKGLLKGPAGSSDSLSLNLQSGSCHGILDHGGASMKSGHTGRRATPPFLFQPSEDAMAALRQ